MPRKITKKSEIKRHRLIQRTFMTICENFVSAFMAQNFNPNDDKVLLAFDKYNEKWKDFARKMINKYPVIYDNRSKREKLIQSFEKFVESLLEKYENKKV